MDDISQRVDNLEREHNSLVAIVVGDAIDRDGGLKAVVREQGQQIVALRKDFEDEVDHVQHYLDVERKDDCLGLKELERRDTLDGEETEVTVAKINMKAYVIAAMIPSTITAILMFIQMFFGKGSPQ